MERTPSVLLLLLVIAIAVTPALLQSRIGDKCIQKNGADGVCRTLETCDGAWDMLKRKEALIYCFRQQSTLIFCCPPVSRAGQRATKRCKEYAEAVFVQKSSGVGRMDTCAMRGVPAKSGGEETHPKEFPHVALLGYKDRKQPDWLCGGSLISDRYILTAAHCFDSRSGPPLVVRLGERDLKNDKELHGHDDYAVEELISYPRRKKVYYDLGLIRVDRDVRFTASIRPACLNTQAELSLRKVIATGWGNADWVANSVSDVLKKMAVTLEQGSVCGGLHRNELTNGYHEESMLCTRELTGSKDICKGESGGPLQARQERHYCMYNIIGVSDFGGACASSPAAVYARVSYFIPWIESVVWPGDA